MPQIALLLASLSLIVSLSQTSPQALYQAQSKHWYGRLASSTPINPLMVAPRFPLLSRSIKRTGVDHHASPKQTRTRTRTRTYTAEKRGVIPSQCSDDQQLGRNPSISWSTLLFFPACTHQYIIVMKIDQFNSVLKLGIQDR